MKFDFTSSIVLIGAIAVCGTALVISTVESPEKTRNVEHLFAFIHGETDVLDITAPATETTSPATSSSYDLITTQSMAPMTTTYETTTTTTLSIIPAAAPSTTTSPYTVVSVANVRVGEEVNTAQNSLGEEVNCDLTFIDRDNLNGQAILYFDRASELGLSFSYLLDASPRSSKFTVLLKSEDDQYQEVNSFTLTKDSLPHELMLTIPDRSFLMIKAINAGEYCFGAQYRIGCSIHSAPITSK